MKICGLSKELGRETRGVKHGVPRLVGARPSRAHRHKLSCVVLGCALHGPGWALLAHRPFFFFLKCQDLYLMLHVN